MWKKRREEKEEKKDSVGFDVRNKKEGRKIYIKEDVCHGYERAKHPLLSTLSVKLSSPSSSEDKAAQVLCELKSIISTHSNRRYENE